MIEQAIKKIAEREDLTRKEAELVCSELMSGKAEANQIGAFLTSLSTKGETIDEISGFASVMREHATKVFCAKDVVLDTCGTGGDGAHTFNISTISALVAAGCGVTVAKHGNKAVSSKCGSADLLSELGVNIDISVEKVEECLKKVGIGFLFAPLLHQAMKYAAPVRKKLGIRTIFNILGPLTNPAGAKYQLLGVYDEKLVEPLAKVLKNLGSKHALVVHGLDGLDEVTTCSETVVAELKNGEVTKYTIKPEDFNIKRANKEDLKGKDASFNAQIARDILKGKPGPQRDIVVLNAGCAIYAGDLAKDIKQGIKLAEQSIDSGKAGEKLELLKKFSHKI